MKLCRPQQMKKLKFLFFRFDIMKKDRERQFFGLYKDRGVADLCVQALIAKYDLDIFMKENQGFDDEVKTILYKEAHKAIDENATIMDVDFDALFDEIEANLHEVAGDKKQRDDYCIELLSAFGSGSLFNSTYMPVALVRKQRNPEVELSDEDKITLKKFQVCQRLYISRNGESLPHGKVEDCYMVLYRLLQKYAKGLDWILLKNRVDIYTIQDDCNIYIKDDQERKNRDPFDYIEFTGSEKIAQNYITDLYNQARIPEELNNDKAKGIFRKAILANLCDENYTWKESIQLLAYFAERMSGFLKLTYKMNQNGTTQTNWKPFETLFEYKGKKQGVNKLKNAKQNWMKNNCKFEPTGYEKIDTLFE